MGVSSRNSLEDSKNISTDSAEVNLLDYWFVIKQRKMLVTFVVGFITLAAIVISLCLPKMYKSTSLILPLGGSGAMGGLAGMAAQFSGLPFLGNLGGVESPSQKFMVLLESRTLAEEVVENLDLTKIFYKDAWDQKKNTWKDGESQPNLEQVVQVLKSHVLFNDDMKSGTIEVSAISTDPELAREIADAYVKGLQNFLNRNSLTLAKRNRFFIEGQLVTNKKNLLEVGKEINEFYKEGRVSNVASRVNVVLGVDNEFNFGTVNTLANNNGRPSEEVLNKFEVQRDDLQKKSSEIQIAKNIPQQVYLQYLTLRRDLLGKINILLTQQYEMAKIEEAKEDLAFQVVDPARVPLKRFKPQRRKIVTMAFMASLFLAFFLVFFLEYVQRMRKQYQDSHRN